MLLQEQDSMVREQPAFGKRGGLVLQGDCQVMNSGASQHTWRVVSSLICAISEL